MPMTEEILVQEITAQYLLTQLQWSVMGLHERLGPEGGLGRVSDQEVVP